MQQLKDEIHQLPGPVFAVFGAAVSANKKLGGVLWSWGDPKNGWFNGKSLKWMIEIWGSPFNGKPHSMDGELIVRQWLSNSMDGEHRRTNGMVL